MLLQSPDKNVTPYSVSFNHLLLQNPKGCGKFGLAYFPYQLSFFKIDESLTRTWYLYAKQFHRLRTRELLKCMFDKELFFY